MPTWREARGAIGRWRRTLRRRILEPVLVGQRSFRETVLNALAARGHLVFCRLDNAVFFVDPSDRAIGSSIMWQGGWQRDEIEGAAKILADAGRLKPGSVFVDAGANIGTQTVYALKSGHFSRAIAFEPEPRNAALLEMNVQANGYADRAVVVKKALGGAAGTATLYLHPRNKGAHALGTPPSVDGLEQIEVPVVRLEAALAEAGITPDMIGMIWIDVEGQEPELIGSLGPLLERAVPLAIEFAPERYGPEKLRGLIELLARHYTVMQRLGAVSRGPEPVQALAGIQERLTDVLVY